MFTVGRELAIFYREGGNRGRGNYGRGERGGRRGFNEPGRGNQRGRGGRGGRRQYEEQTFIRYAINVPERMEIKDFKEFMHVENVKRTDIIGVRELYFHTHRQAQWAMSASPLTWRGVEIIIQLHPFSGRPAPQQQQQRAPQPPPQQQQRPPAAAPWQPWVQNLSLLLLPPPPPPPPPPPTTTPTPPPSRERRSF